MSLKMINFTPINRNFTLRLCSNYYYHPSYWYSLLYLATNIIRMLLMQRRLKGVGKSRVSDTREHHPMVQQSAQNRSIVIFFGRGTSLNLRMALSTWAKKAQVSTHPSEDIPEVFSILSLTTNYLFQSKYSRIMRRMQAVVGLLR